MKRKRRLNREDIEEEVYSRLTNVIEFALDHASENEAKRILTEMLNEQFNDLMSGEEDYD